MLVVDDNAMNLKVVKNLMKLNGIVPDQVLSGMEAIEMIRRKNYDIVFLDHMMPKMDGIETLAKIKEEHLKAEGMTIIALTANAVVGAKEIYLQAGFDDYLSKPIEVDRLEKKLAKYLPKDIVSWRANGKKNDVEVSEELPDEEILEFAPMDIEDSEDGMVSSDGIIQKVGKIGLSADDGLRFCGGDEDFYVEMLKDYVGAYEGKAQELERFFERKDWHEYQTMVHALKSTSKTIGATDIFERAKSLEEASGKVDVDFIENNHAKLLADYKVITDKIAVIFIPER